MGGISMNLAYNLYQDQDREYQRDEDRAGVEKIPRTRRANYARASRPAVHNGIHRRRNKRLGK
jgi:hypothetical protein